MILVLIVVTAFFAWRTGGAILLPMNVSSLISQNAYVFILATGMLLCILTGGNIDLSVGSVVCFVGAIGAVLMVNMKMNMWLAILIMFVIGTLIGAFQGFWIAYVRIPPFIVTLAGMLAFRGLSNVVLQGMTVSIKDCTTFVNLFGGGADLGAAGVVHARGAAALVVQGGDLVNAKDDLVNVALVGVVVLAHHSRINLAECGLRLHVVAGQILFAERVVVGSGQLHRADRENAVCHIVFRLLEVCHGHIGQVVVGLPAFGDLGRNARGSVSGIHGLIPLSFSPPSAQSRSW